MDRKSFLKTTALTAIGGFTALSSGVSAFSSSKRDLFFDISLAQWSLNRSYFGASRDLSWQEFGNLLQNSPADLIQGNMDPLYFARHARELFGINAIEYVNTFYFDKADDQSYLNELKNVADNEGVSSVLIMCDAEGALGDPDESARQQAVENHYKWIEMAKFLGCHSIRVNAQSEGSYEEQSERAADGLRRLSEYAAPENINIIVENHGGLSSNGDWLTATIEKVNLPNCGTLPDFGNFNISPEETYDRYKGTEQLMKYAKGVSAKTHDFKENGDEQNMDYLRLMRIVKDAGYTGYVGIEYEGENFSEKDGIIKTKELLEKAGNELS